MPSDERYRSWLRNRDSALPPTPGLLPATLARASWCPASAGCRELHFEVAGAAWSWCFPPGGATEAPDDVVLVLRPGPHGLIAEAWPPASSGLSCPLSRLDLASAAFCALAGCPVFVHQSLVAQTQVPLW